MSIHIGITKENCQKMVIVLQQLLANEFVLYTKTLKYHWNIEGSHFGPLHLLFQNQYEQLFHFIDDIAERIRALGSLSSGTLKEFITQSTLKEQAEDNPKDMEMIRNLLNDHETIIQQLRKDIELTVMLNDMGTNNFLCDLIEKHEKTAWMLRAHIA